MGNNLVPSFINLRVLNSCSAYSLLDKTNSKIQAPEYFREAVCMLKILWQPEKNDVLEIACDIMPTIGKDVLGIVGDIVPTLGSVVLEIVVTFFQTFVSDVLKIVYSANVSKECPGTDT